MSPENNDDWFDPKISTFGDRLAGAREGTGMTQKEMSKRLGVKLSTVKGWENDLSEPRANRLSMMAGLLNVSIMWLINGEGEGPEGPMDEQGLNTDVNDMLLEIRHLKTQISGAADRLGRLEKQLRIALSGD